MPGNEVELRAESGRTLTLPYLPTHLSPNQRMNERRRLATRTTTTMTTTKEEDCEDEHEGRLQHPPLVCGFTCREKINYYIYENTRREQRRWNRVVFTEVGPLERRLRSTDDSFSTRRERKRKMQRKRDFCPPWSPVCIAPRLYSSDQKWRVRSSRSNESFRLG